MQGVLRKGIGILGCGIAAALAWWVGLMLVFGPAQMFLADPTKQSQKFLEAFTTPPLPRMAQGAEILASGLLVIGIIHACVYAWLQPRLPGNVLRRGLTFGTIAWALMVPWFEFYLPWNVMLEPLPLVFLEALCWLIVLLGVGVSIALVHCVAERFGGDSLPPR
jgi:hypothetical protein